MNNPGIELERWKQLREKWSELDAEGHKVKIEFKLITDPKDKNRVIVIDVIQNIDENLITETVQRTAGEAYDLLSIRGASMEYLVGHYKQTLEQLLRRSGQRDMVFIVTMSPTSSTSGELRASLENEDSTIKTSVQVNYHHYYILNALRERMIKVLGDGWSKVKVVYSSNQLEFYFEY